MRLQLLLMGVVGVALAGGVGAWELTRIGVHQGYGPEQPIPFRTKSMRETTRSRAFIAIMERGQAAMQASPRPASA